MVEDAPLGTLLYWAMCRIRPVLMAWRRFFRTGLNSMSWYHCARSVLVIAAREFIAAGSGWFGGWSGFLVRLT